MKFHDEFGLIGLTAEELKRRQDFLLEKLQAIEVKMAKSPKRDYRKALLNEEKMTVAKEYRSVKRTLKQVEIRSSRHDEIYDFNHNNPREIIQSLYGILKYHVDWEEYDFEEQLFIDKVQHYLRDTQQEVKAESEDVS